MVYSFALSQFFYFVDVPSPQHCKSLALVLHCFRFLEHCIAIAAKTPSALSYRSYRCYIYVTPLGSKLPQCVWRSRIADRNNAPVPYRVCALASAMTTWVGSEARNYRNVVKVLKNLKGVKLGQKRAVFYDNTNNM